MATNTTTIKKEDCDAKHRDLHDEIQGLRSDVKRLIIGVCGSVEGDKPGILQRINTLEVRWKILVGTVGSGTVLAVVGLIIKFLLK